MENHLITEQLEGISRQILQNAKTELYLNMRYLDLALSGLKIQMNTQLWGIGTDGNTLAVHPKVLADLYEEDRRLVNRVYLHSVYHCLFHHLWKRGYRDGQLWRISCDLAVEALIDSMNCRSVRMGVSRFRRNWYDSLKKERKVLTAEGIYRSLQKRNLTPWMRKQLEDQFCIDDHSLWPKEEPQGKPPQPQMEMQRTAWQEIAEKTQTQMETFSREASRGAGDLQEQMRAENRERQDYRSFLRKFAVMREEMQVDPDTFDYVFYSYGLSLYGNMPLIEYQEFKETKKIQEFAIVIDVSMSTSGALVKTFLEQTYAVLTERESFFQKVNIHILQCDEQVRADQKITSQEELKDYMEHFTLMGNGGTDFRPAFAYVNELIEKKQFYNLRGLIYFTDGYGIYPGKRPAYETAFVFMEEEFTDVQVPPWAIKLVVEKETLEEESCKKGRLSMDGALETRFIWEEDQK